MSEVTSHQSTKCQNLQPIRAQNVRTYSQSEHKMFKPTTNQSTKCPNLQPIRAQNVQTYCQSEHKMAEPTANQSPIQSCRSLYSLYLCKHLKSSPKSSNQKISLLVM